MTTHPHPHVSSPTRRTPISISVAHGSRKIGTASAIKVHHNKAVFLVSKRPSTQLRTLIKKSTRTKKG